MGGILVRKTKTNEVEWFTPLEAKRVGERLGRCHTEILELMRNALEGRALAWARRGGTPEDITRMLACDVRACGERFVTEIELNRIAAAAFRDVIRESRSFGAQSTDPALTEATDISAGFSEMEDWLDYRTEQYHFGIWELDNAIGGGVMKGQILSIIGNPGAMKTSLALSGIERWMLESTENAAFFSLDMGVAAAFERLMIREMRCPRAVFRDHYHRSSQEYCEAKEKILKRYGGRLTLLGNERTRWDVERLRRYITFNTPGLVVIDYLTLLKRKGQTDYDVANEAILCLQDLSRKYGIAVVVLSQMSVSSRREQAGGGSGGTARGGGIVDEISDIEIELFRDRAETTIDGKSAAPIIATITKTRNGVAGSHWWLDYNGPTMSFTGTAHRVQKTRNNKPLFDNA